MKKAKTGKTAVACAVLALLAAQLQLGCGSSSKGSNTTPQKLAVLAADSTRESHHESSSPRNGIDHPEEAVVATLLGEYYVVTSTLNVRSAPRTGEIVNKLHLQQLVTVSAVDDGWGRITPVTAPDRWVSMEYLSRTRPELPASSPTPDSMKDPRIMKDAIPKVGENGLTQRDVDILWQGANWALRTGRCSCIEYADKSVSRANTYFVLCCGASQNLFFTPSDIK